MLTLTPLQAFFLPGHVRVYKMAMVLVDLVHGADLDAGLISHMPPRSELMSMFQLVGCGSEVHQHGSAMHLVRRQRLHAAAACEANLQRASPTLSRVRGGRQVLRKG
eukprot:444943-Hanusia_phi.AAC.1